LNEKICLEYDTWDNDRGEVKTKQKYFGWTDCASSFLQTCISSTNTSTENTQKTGNGSILALVERGYRNASMNYEDPEKLKKIIYLPQEDLTYDDTIEAFWDLEVTAGEGRYVVETIKYSSVFSDPESFISEVAETNAGASGRSLSTDRNHSAVEITKQLEDERKHLKDRAQERARNKSRVYTQLTSRKAWFQRKIELNSILRKYSDSLALGQYYKVKNNPEKLQSLKRYRNASEVLDELEALGQTFQVNEVPPQQLGELHDESNTLAKVILRAEEEHGRFSSSDDNSVTSSFGRALTQVMAKTGEGMNGRAFGELDSKVAETIAKSNEINSAHAFQFLCYIANCISV
jgi:hypothetical protein